MKLRLNFLIIFILLPFLLIACSEGGQPSQAPAKSKSVKKTAKTPVVKELEPEKEEVYVYDPVGKRDPFENPLKVIVEVDPGDGVPLTPLQKFDLSQLRLIGVIIGKGEPRGMVIAPDGKSFILKKGIKVGKNNGSVVDITTDAVLVEEKYFDFSGEVKTSIQEIMLPKKGGVK